MKLHVVTEVKINPEYLTVQKENILSLLGYGTNDSEEHIDEIIDKCIFESKNILQPQGSFVIMKNEGINLPDGKLFAGNLEFHIGKIIASQIKNAEYIAFFMCTIGKQVELHSKQHMEKGDLLEGYIFDLIGSETAEAVAEYVHNSIKEVAAKEQLSITNRFSPGYCDWNVKEQFKLFSLFCENHCGIKLTSSALMNPIKSVSGILGIGENVKFKPYTCSMCGDENCIYRNRKKR